MLDAKVSGLVKCFSNLLYRNNPGASPGGIACGNWIAACLDCSRGKKISKTIEEVFRSFCIALETSALLYRYAVSRRDGKGQWIV